MISAFVSDTFLKLKPRLIQSPSRGNKSIFSKTLAVLTQQEKKRFRFLVILDLAISIIDILSLALLLLVINFYIQPSDNSTLSFLPGWMLDKTSVVAIAVFFFVFSAKNLFAFFIARKQNSFIAKVAVRLAKNNLVQYQNSEFDEFVNVDSSVHIRKIAHQPFDFCQHMLAGVQQIITQVSLIAIAIIAIILFDARLFLLLLLILLPPVIGIFYFIKKRLTKVKLQLKTSNQLSYQYLMDALKGFVEGNIYGRNSFFLQRFLLHRRKFSMHLFESVSMQYLPARLIEIFAIMGLFILIGIATWTGNVNGIVITVGTFMVAAYKIIPGMVKIINTLSQMKAYEFTLNDIANVEGNVSDKTERPVEKIRSLKFSNISFQFNEIPVINRLSFSAHQGDFIGITGKSGKGKTTLFNLLLGFLSPGSGEISMNGETVSKKDIKNLWPAISYVRQQGFFIHDTVLRNITLEEENYNDKRLEYSMRAAGILIKDSSDGFDKIVAENGKNISGGQQQRIALARALYKDADLVLLDEPFNELDEASELLFLHQFKELAGQGKIVIMITHNRKALSFCNKIISLDDGV